MSAAAPPRFLLLAAGEGKRLEPESRTCPKALTNIGGAPLLDRWFHALEAFSAAPLDVLVNAHHLPCQLAARVALYDRRSQSRWRVYFEPTLLGTAGTVRRHARWLNGETDTILIYADNYSSIDLRRFYADHAASGAPATLALFRCERPEACGIAALDEDGVLSEFIEKPAEPTSNLANAGVLAFRAGVFARLLRETDADLSRDVLPRLVGQAVGWHMDGFHYDIGTADSLAQVRRRVAAGEIG